MDKPQKRGEQNTEKNSNSTNTMFSLVPSLTYNLRKTNPSLYQLDLANLDRHWTELVPTSALLAEDLKNIAKLVLPAKPGSYKNKRIKDMKDKK